ncbi:hypothetical protein, partial [Rhodopila globiformis]|uniref:hypothetical protein n=1 Tax=Rhodopila globiformis TaxID=1071 RepID=UPI00195C39B4
PGPWAISLGGVAQPKESPISLHTTLTLPPRPVSLSLENSWFGFIVAIRYLPRPNVLALSGPTLATDHRNGIGCAITQVGDAASGLGVQHE